MIIMFNTQLFVYIFHDIFVLLSPWNVLVIVQRLRGFNPTIFITMLWFLC